MTNIILLTSSKRGVAAFKLEEMLKSKQINVKAVVLNQNLVRDGKGGMSRKVKKILKVGPLGVLYGVKMRKWLSAGPMKYLDIKPIDKICADNNIPFHTTPTINCQETVDFITQSGADVGLSLGYGYMDSNVYNAPKYGVLNIHHEELPYYRNAQSVIWRLHNKSSYMCYTVHKVDEHFDKGEILFQEEVPLKFKDSLEDTISYNYAELWKRAAKGLVMVLEGFDNYFQNKKEQPTSNAYYHAPTYLQFLKIKKHYQQMKKETAGVS